MLDQDSHRIVVSASAAGDSANRSGAHEFALLQIECAARQAAAAGLRTATTLLYRMRCSLGTKRKFTKCAKGQST